MNPMYKVRNKQLVPWLLVTFAPLWILRALATCDIVVRSLQPVTASLWFPTDLKYQTTSGI